MPSAQHDSAADSNREHPVSTHFSHSGLFQYLVESSGDLILLVDGDGGIVYSNDSCMDLLGYTAESMTEHELTEFVHHEDLIILTSLTAKPFDRESIVTMRFRHAQGYWISLGTRIRKAPDDVMESGVILRLRDITEHSRILRKMAYKIQLEDLITEVSSRLIMLNPEDVDDEVRRILEDLGRLLKVDTTYLFTFTEDLLEMSCEYEWCREGHPSQIETQKDVRFRSRYPWWAKQILECRVIHIPNVDDLPDQAAAEKTEFRRQGLKSILDVPMIIRQKLNGFIGYSTSVGERNFSEDEIMLLKVVGNLLVNTLRRKTLQISLENNERRFRTLFETANDGLFIVNGEIVEDINAAAVGMLGFTQEELTNRHIREVFPPTQPGGDSSLELARAKLRSLRHGKSIRFEFIHRRKNRSPLDTEVTLTPLKLPEGDRVLAMLRDITRRKADEARLRRSESRYRTLFDKSPALNLVVDDEMRIVECNRSFYRNLGYRKEELIGTSVLQHMDEKSANIVRSSERSMLRKQGGSLPATETIFWAADGSERVLRAGRGIRERIYQEESFLGYLIELVDITEQRRVEEREREQREELYQAAKLASLGTLLSGVTHEINNPNNYIRLSIDNLSEFWPDMRQVLDEWSSRNGEFRVGGLPYRRSRTMVNDMISGIRDGSQRIEKLVADLKDFVRKGDHRRFEMENLNEIVEDAIKLIRTEINRSTAGFAWTPASHNVLVPCDRQQLQQIVLNLISNSCQALEDTAQGIAVRVFLEPDHQMAVVHVRDEGRGIPKEDLPHIMDPFFTTKRSQGGTGLGLAVSHRIASDHNGVLEFSSVPRQGTDAMLKIPLPE